MAGMVESSSNCEREDHVAKSNYNVSTGEIIWILSRRNKNEKTCTIKAKALRVCARG